jgi:hypothetical protein
MAQGEVKLQLFALKARQESLLQTPLAIATKTLNVHTGKATDAVDLRLKITAGDLLDTVSEYVDCVEERAGT